MQSLFNILPLELNMNQQILIQFDTTYPHLSNYAQL